MPIKAAKLQDEVRRKLNRVNSDYGRELEVSTLDLILTEAYHLYVENRLALFEINSAVRSELRQLEVKAKQLTPKVFSKDNTTYTANYPSDYLRCSRLYATASKDGCGTKSLKGIIVQTDDLNEALRDPFFKPSFEYEELLYDEGRDGIHIYTDGTFKVIDVFIDYIKKPGDIKTPSLYAEKYYVDAEGKEIRSDSHMELDSAFQMRKVVDIATLIALRDLGDIQDYQTQLDKILKTESLYLTN